jgi:translocator protein
MIFNKINWKHLIIAIIICQLAGIVGSLFTFEAIPTWYSTLAKPDFTPPSWVFGPAWISLYTLMGGAIYLIWQKKDAIAIRLFSIQLALNALWSISFFGLKNPLLGLINIIILWIVLVATIIRFYKIDKNAAYLLIPYLLWSSFATILNLAIVLLN